MCGRSFKSALDDVDVENQEENVLMMRLCSDGVEDKGR